MSDDRQRPGAHLTAVLDDDAFYAGDPFPHYARLRAEAPVAWHADPGYWVVTSHPEVLAVSRDPDTFCSAKGILAMEIGIEYPTPPTMMHIDPPEHTRYRKLVQPAFSPAAVRAVGEVVRARVAELVDALPSGGEVVEVVDALSAPLSLDVMAFLLDVPASDRDRFRHWSDATIPGAGDFTVEERFAAMGEMQAYLMEAARARADRPGDGLISTLVNVEVDGERLSEDELLMFLNQLLVAGNETTRNLISGGLWALAERPGEWARLAADRSLVASAVEECLRWTTPVVAFLRTATRETELRGVAIAAGEPVLMLYAAANRDPDVFGADAEDFRVDRSPNPQLAFGFGAHFCIGAALARLEAAALLEALLERFPGGPRPAGEVQRSPSGIIAGVTSAPLTFA